uniref:Clip domain-containing protein n=1 Tax=Panagrellus redivivus TaxID=6233 RepID=A0A7E4VC40_PANRE
MLLHRILVIIAIIGIMESVTAGIMNLRLPREDYNDDEFHTIMDKLTNELIDDEGDADHYRRERVETKETKPLNDDNATSTIDDTVSDMMYLEPPRPSNATQVITSSYETVEIPVSQNLVVQKVQPQTTINPILSSTTIPITDKVETEDNETTTTPTASTSTSTTTTSASLVETTVPPNSTTVETVETTTSSCPDTVTQEAESIESPPELPIKPEVKTDEPYTPIWIKIINGMRCSMRDCHGVLIPTEAYPTEELPTIPMTRFIRGESDNVIPPCPCSRKRQPIDMDDMETGTLHF